MKHFLNKHATIKHRLYSLYYTLFSYGRGLLVLTICLLCGNLISHLLPIMIPGSIIGLLILFFLLALHIIPVCWVKNSCSFFMRYMMVLFIPAAVGIMDNYPLFMENWVPIVIGCIGGSVIVLLFTAFLTEHIYKPRSILDTSTQQDEEEKIS